MKLFLIIALTMANGSARLIPRVEAVGHTGLIKGVAYTPDGRYIVTASEDKTVRIWERETGRLVKVIRGQIGPGHEGMLYALAISPDGKYIAVGGYGVGVYGKNGSGKDYIFIYTLPDGKLVKRLVGHSNVIYALAFSPDGKYLASGSHDNTVIIWDTGNWKRLKTLRGHRNHINSVAFLLDSRHLVSASLDSTLRVWDIRTGETVHILRDHEAEVIRVAVSLDGLIASGSFDHTIKLWHDGEEKKTFEASDEVDALAFTPDGKKLIASTYDDNITLWDVESGRSYLLGSHTNSVFAVAVSPDGREAVSCGGNQQEIIRWDLKTKKKISELKSMGKIVYRAGFSRSGDAIGFGYTWWKIDYSFDFNSLDVHEAVDSDFMKEKEEGGGIELVIKKVPKYPHERLFVRVKGELKPIAVNDLWYWDRVNCASLTPDNRYIVVGTAYGLFLYDTDGNRIREYVGHYGEVWGVAVSPDGELLASASVDQTVRLWNLKTGELLLTIFYSVEDGEWVAMTPAGYYVSSPHGDRYIGWHENRGLDREARFYRLSQFYKEFYNPEFVRKVIKYRSVEKALDWLEKERHRKPPTYEDIVNRRPPEVRILEPWDGTKTEYGQIEVVAKIRYPEDAPIERIRVLVNGAGALSTKSISVEGASSAEDGMKEIEYRHTVSLEQGRNLIEVVAENRYGQSNKAGVVVYYQPGSTVSWEKPDLYLLAIGVSNFANPGYQLRFADADARSIVEQFKTQEGKLFRRVHVRLLTNEEATRAAILDALDWLDANATQHDLVIVSVSTHGMLDRRGSLYIFPYDGDADRLRSTAVKFNDFRDVLTNLPGKVILLLDVCHAGAGEWVAMRGLKDDDVKKLVKEFSEAGSSVAVFASSTGREYSAESPALGHGVFTKAVLDALSRKGDLNHDGVIHLKEFDHAVTGFVRDLCKRYNCFQHVKTTYPYGTVDYPIFMVK